MNPDTQLSGDLRWLWISAALTGALGTVALSLMTALPFRGLPDPVTSLASWFAWTFFACGFSIIRYTIALMRSAQEHPIRKLIDNWNSGKVRYAILLIGMTLAGLDMYFYMIMKPELNLLFPFWADPYLANIDASTLGRDGWSFFRGWNLEFVSWVYSPAWFFGVLLTFYWLLLKPPSAAKSTAIVAYFGTWSVFGTLGQAVLSSGGPIFYHRLGFGDRFAAIPVPQLEARISNYLWQSYQQHALVPGAGISAMPSLHIASMTWMVLVFAGFRSRLTVPAALLSLFIYAGSVALGWHYATDGVVGAAGALLCYALARRCFLRESKSDLVPAPA